MKLSQLRKLIETLLRNMPSSWAINDEVTNLLTKLLEALPDEPEHPKSHTVVTARKIGVSAIREGESHRFLLGRPFPEAQLLDTKEILLASSSSVLILGIWSVREDVLYERIGEEYERAGKSPSDTASLTGDIPLDPLPELNPRVSQRSNGGFDR